MYRKVDGMFDENGAIGHDPFLQAQEVPQDFSVDPGMVERTAVVHLQFGSDYVKYLLITTDEMGRRITAINEVNTNDS